MKIRLVWSKANHHYRHLKGRLFVRMHGESVDKTRAGGQRVLAVNMLRVAAYLGIAASIAYVGLVTLVFLFVREPSNRRVSWWHVAAPWKWNQSRQVIAEESVSRGLNCLKTQRYAEAIMQIESGLRRAPWKNDGRIELARFYVAALMPVRAIQLLDTGRTYVASDPRALDIAAVTGFFVEDYGFLLRYCDTVLASAPPAPAAVLDSARTHRIAALLGAGRIEEAASYASTIQKPANAAQAEAIVRAFVEAHQYEPAMARIEVALKRSPGELQLAGLRARVRRETKDLSTLVLELDAFAADNRTLAGAQLLCVKEFWQAGMEEEASKALDKYFRYFEAQPANLIQAARVLVQLPKSESLIEACLARAKELGHRQEPLWVALTEVHLLAGDLNGMRPWLEKLKESKTKDPSAKSWMELMSNLLASSDEANKAFADRLLESMKTLRVPPSVLETIVKALFEAKKPLAAAAVANYGRLVFPNNVRLTKLAESMKSLDVQMEQSRVMSAPSVVRRDESEGALFKQLEQLIDGKQWTPATALIISIRNQQPEWFRRREKDLLWAELRIASLSDDTLKLQSTMRSFLQGDLTRRNEAFKFAQSLRTDGKISQEEVVLREILRGQPDDTLVSKRLMEIKKAKKPE